MDSNNATEILDHGNIHPWVRYWARYIDMYFLIMLVMMLQAVFFPTEQLDLDIAAIGIYFVWILLEAQLLATWGTTPGKWLLKTKVRDLKNNKLTLKTALIRGSLVWFVGLGMTLFTPITEVISFMSLREKKITFWDKYCKCNVTHEKFGAERIPLILGFIILPLFILEFL